MKNNKMFPMYVDLSEKKILIAGGGKIAERRVKSLLPFAGEILVVSPEITDLLKQLADEGSIIWKQREYSEMDLLSMDIVLGATDSNEVNEKIYNDCKKKGITVNISSDKNKCDFHFPGLIQYEDVVIGFNSGGSNHKKTRQVREKVQDFLEGKN